MAVQNPPYSMQTGAHGAELFRRAVGSVLNTAGGVVALGDLAVTGGYGVMAIAVAAGSVWIPGTTTTAQGTYYCFNDASVSLAIAAASATNPRIDTIVAQVEDAAYAGATNAWKLAVVTGTATVGATLANLTGAGAVPASSLVLAYVLVAANATTITAGAVQDNRIFARPNLPMRSNPAGRCYLNTNKSPATGLFAANWATTYAYGGMTVGATTGLTVPVSGYYQINGASTATQSSYPFVWWIGIAVNGSAVSQGTCAQGTAAATTCSTVNDVLYVTAGQAITLSVVLSTLIANANSGQYNTYLSATLVSI